MSVRAVTLLAALTAALTLPALGVAADPVNQPNDPAFPSQWNFKGPAEGIDTATYPIARDPDNAMGIDFTGAWKQGNIGRPDILVAYIEGGVNYDSDNIKDGLDNIFINRGELPHPDTIKHGSATSSTTRGNRPSPSARTATPTTATTPTATATSTCAITSTI